MTPSRYHIDLNEIAKKIVRIRFPTIMVLAVSYTVFKVESSVNSVESPSIYFGIINLDYVPFYSA